MKRFTVNNYYSIKQMWNLKLKYFLPIVGLSFLTCSGEVRGSDRPLNYLQPTPTIAQITTATKPKSEPAITLKLEETIKTLGYPKIIFTPDGGFLLIASKNDIDLWNIKTQKKIRTFSGHISGAWAMATSSDGKTLVSRGDRTLRIWDLSTGKLIHTLNVSRDENNLAISSNGQLFVTDSSKFVLKVFDVKTAKLIRTLPSLRIQVPLECLYVEFLSAHPDGKTVFYLLSPLLLDSPCIDKLVPSYRRQIPLSRVKVQNIKTGKELLDLPIRGFIESFALIPEQQTLVVAVSRCNAGSNCYPNGQQTVQLWNLETGQLIRNLDESSDPASIPVSLAISSDNKVIVGSGRDGSLTFWNLVTGNRICKIKVERTVQQVRFDPARQLLAFAESNRVTLWRFKFNESGVQSCQLSQS